MFALPSKASGTISVPTELQRISSLILHPMDIYQHKTCLLFRDIQGFVHQSHMNSIQLCINQTTKTVSDGITCEHHFLFTTDNHLYVQGLNHCGQCAMGNNINLQPIKTLTSLPENIMNGIFLNLTFVQIKCGYGHTLFLTNTGNVYGCGFNTCFQIGVPNDSRNEIEDILSPVQIPLLANIVHISVGANYNICIDDKYAMFVFGSNYDAQLGIVDKVVIEEPMVHPFFGIAQQPYRDIQCSVSHSGVIDFEGNTYLFGENYDGQIGNGFKDRLPVYEPFLLDLKCEQLALGYFHTLLLTVENELYACGSNAFNTCSNVIPIWQNVHSPVLWKKSDLGIDEQSEEIVRIMAGHSYSMVIKGRKRFSAFR